METLSVGLVLGLTGLVILVGLAGELVFKRTGIPGTELFPIYALTVIALCVLGMTLVLTLYKRRHSASSAESVAELSVS